LPITVLEKNVPTRAWPLWALTVLLLAGLPAVGFAYWSLALSAGLLPDYAGGLWPLLRGHVVVAVELSPPTLLVAGASLRRYNPQTRFAAWRTDRPVRSLLMSICFGIPAAVMTLLVVMDIHESQLWFDYIWSAYGSLWIIWLLGMRAAIIEQSR
jgi:hypothetical protein